MADLPASYQQYQRLVERVETFGAAIHQRYPGQVTCHAGCDGCCYQQFTIFAVEALHLARAIRRLPLAGRQRLQQRLQGTADPWRVLDEPQPCVLLDDGCCSVYEGRPLICRLHGLPLSSTMIERADGSQRDCCPLNFADIPLERLDAQSVYNLDLVNQTLAAIHRLFVQECQQADQRLTIRQVALQALDTTPPEVSTSC